MYMYIIQHAHIHAWVHTHVQTYIHVQAHTHYTYAQYINMYDLNRGTHDFARIRFTHEL